MCAVPGRGVFEFARGQRCERVYDLPGRCVLVCCRFDRVCELPDQHVFRRVRRVVLPAVPGERDVGGGERVAGVLLLQERVRARGGLVHVPDLRSRHVQQPARAHGVLELLGGALFGELRRDRQRDVSVVRAGGVVAGGQPELQLMPGELAGGERERVAEQLRLRRGVYRTEWGNLYCMRCG